MATRTNSRSGLPPLEVMRDLAEHSPDQLASLRNALVARVIRNARPENRRRLLGLQFQMDMIRERSSNPLSACIEMSERMLDALQTLDDVFQGADPGHRTRGPKAEVLRFPDKI